MEAYFCYFAYFAYFFILNILIYNKIIRVNPRIPLTSPYFALLRLLFLTSIFTYLLRYVAHLINSSSESYSSEVSEVSEVSKLCED